MSLFRHLSEGARRARGRSPTLLRSYEMIAPMATRPGFQARFRIPRPPGFRGTGEEFGDIWVLRGIYLTLPEAAAALAACRGEVGQVREFALESRAWALESGLLENVRRLG